MITTEIEKTSKAPYARCWECPLQNKRPAFSTGPADAKIAVVSRSPGVYEAAKGKVFSGPSGRVLDHLLKLHGLSRADVLCTNTVLCQCDDTPPGAAIEACRSRLEFEIRGCETIIAAGREASYVTIGESAIGANRGYVHYRESDAGLRGVKRQRVIVTNNPAVVLRDDGSFPELVRDFKLAIDPLPAPVLPTVRWTNDLGEAKQWVNKILSTLESGTILATDIETRGRDGKSGLEHNAEIVCAGFSSRSERAVVFGEKVCTDRTFLRDFLRQLWEREDIVYLWHNGKYDCKILRSNGIQGRVDEDTMLLSYALDERPGDPESGAGGHSIEWLLKDELGWPKYEPYSVKDFKKTGILRQPRELYEYNGMDCAGSLALFEALRTKAKHDGVWEKPYKSLLIPLSEALTKVELEGMLHDEEAASNILEAEVWPKLQELRDKGRQLSGKPTLNFASPQQMSKLLYDEWGITHNLTRSKIEAKGKRSVDKNVREEILRGDYKHDASEAHAETIRLTVEAFHKYKELNTQRGTYLEGMVLKRWSNGRVYYGFNIHGTESGRLSSSKPNIQNVTRPKEGVPNIRQTFLADPGCTLISADFNQAELRAAAVLSGDPELQGIYLDTSRSLHKEVATQFYGSNYTYEQYVRAKNINFSVIYWISAKMLFQLYRVPENEAQKFIDFWWERFPKVHEWTHKIADQVINTGEIQSPFGHKRRFYVIPQDRSGREHILREGINFLPQNIAGNLTNWALCKLVNEKLDSEIAQVRINVHDNIVVNTRTSKVAEVGQLIKETMESAAKEAINWDFPFPCELSFGPNWGNLEPLEL